MHAVALCSFANASMLVTMAWSAACLRAEGMDILMTCHGRDFTQQKVVMHEVF